MIVEDHGSILDEERGRASFRATCTAVGRRFRLATAEKIVVVQPVQRVYPLPTLTANCQVNVSMSIRSCSSLSQGQVRLLYRGGVYRLRSIANTSHFPMSDQCSCLY